MRLKKLLSDIHFHILTALIIIIFILAYNSKEIVFNWSNITNRIDFNEAFSTLVATLFGGGVLLYIQQKRENEQSINTEKTELNIYLAHLENMLEMYFGCLESYKKLGAGFRLENSLTMINAKYRYKNIGFVAEESRHFYTHIIHLETEITRTIEKLKDFKENKPRNPNIRKQGERLFMITCAQLYGQIKTTIVYLKKYYDADLSIEALNDRLANFKSLTIDEAAALANRNGNSDGDSKMLETVKASHEAWVLPLK